MRIKPGLTEINQENLWLALVMRVKPRLTEINQENFTANKIQ